MIGISLHSRSRRQTSMPCTSGSIRSTIAACGPCSAARSSASSPVAGDQHLVAGLAQHEPQRPPDLRVVVADEDALARHQRARPAPRRRRRPRRRRTAGARASRSSGNSITKLVPWPGHRLDRDAPAVDLDEALGDREPEPGAVVAAAPLGAGRRGRRAGRRAPARRAGCPGPWSTIAHAQRARRPRGRAPTRAARASSATAFSSTFANARSSCAGSPCSSGSSRVDRELRRISPARRSCSTASCRTSSIEHQPTRGSTAARPAAARGRAASRSARHSRVAGVESRARAPRRRCSAVGRARVERARRRQDRRHRRAQVVRDRAQHGRLHLVAAPQRRRLDDLGLQLGAVQRRGEDRLERGHDALAHPRALGARRASPASIERRRRVAPPCAAAAAEAAPLGGGSSAEPDRGADRRPSACGEPLARPSGSASSQPRRAEQQLRQLGREVGLAAALVGLALRAPARARRRRPDDDRDRRRTPRARPSRAPSASVKSPGGGRWKKLKAAALSTDGRRRRSRGPRRSTTTTHREQVDDAERLTTGATCLSG